MRRVYTVCFSEAFGGYWDCPLLALILLEQLGMQAAFEPGHSSMNGSLVWDPGVRVRSTSETHMEGPRQPCA